MSRRPWATYLWPGLPQVCQHGSWSGLAVAMAFAGLLNLGLAASLVWCELLTPGVRTVVWTAILAIWGGAAMFSSRGDRKNSLRREETAQPNDTFAEAVDFYLKGSWFEAERLLVELLRHNPRDVDAELMLATMLRHLGRRGEAAEHLDRMDRLESSAKWQWEIQGERRRLREPSADEDESEAEIVLESAAEHVVSAERAA